MTRRIAALVAAIVVSTSAVAHNRAEVRGPDAFDETLLRIDEGRYLGQPIAAVDVRTETRTVPLLELARGEPLVLLLGYYSCHGACPTTIRNLAQALAQVRGGPSHQVAVLSFDSNDTLETMRTARADLGEVPPEWNFGLLDRDAATRLTESVGYRFQYSERDQAFLHPSVLIFVSPAGRVTRYLYGVAPRAQDIELALAEAAQNTSRLNDIVHMAKLVCYRYDAARSRYVLHPAVLFGTVGLLVLGMTGVAAMTFKKDINGVRT